MILFGPYEAQCPGGIVPGNAVTKVTDGGNVEVIYIPTEKGAVYHEATEPFVLAEGGRGSAKSTTLRWDAHLRNLMIEGHRALLLRRTFPQLRGSHFARVAVEGKKLGCVRDFNQSKFFLEYNNGSLLQFGHCESDSAILDYLSQEWDWIGFDELTTFTFDQFIRISASARLAASESRSGRVAFVRAATNPIGEGASWVKRYFIDRNVTEQENPEYRKDEWRSIKMNVVDNPHMGQEYRRKLEMLPNESLRRAYIDGEWLVEGQFFHEMRERTDAGEWHVIETLPQWQGVRLDRLGWVEVTRFIDWGYSEIEPGYCGWILHAPDGSMIWFKEWVFTQQTPEMAARKIAEMSRGMKIRQSIGDPMMWQEREGQSIAHRFASHGVSMQNGRNDRENGWMSVHSWLTTTYFDGVRMRPRLQLLMGQGGADGLGVPYAIRTLPSLQTDPKKPKDIMQPLGVEDHAADALRYWASRWPTPSMQPQKNLDWAAPELRRMILEAVGGVDSELPLGSESASRHEGEW